MNTLSYRASLKNLAVEEPIDLLVHRPIAYVIARALLPTRVSPDAVTVLSMLAGIGAGVALVANMLTGYPLHVLAGALLIASAVLDCADGQLARMRGTSSVWGRMLDGAVDGVVQITALPAVVAYMFWHRGGLRAPHTAWWLLATVVAALSGWRHTTVYDHYKTSYVRNTDPGARECDDLAEVRAQWLAVRARGNVTLGEWARFTAYVTHLDLIAKTLSWLDPAVPSRYADMPPWSAASSERYRRLNERLMRAWSFYGVGTHIFLTGLGVMLDRVEWVILVRIVLFDGALAWLVPAQRRASRAFFGTAP